uniref:Uncharacterized protein ycf23 n=1 Tax=Polysiphonia sp. TaxID=1967842 RepID=A0A1Z1M3U0_9FLOR|nr:hypothetical protein [Polysiphonia sp.]
MNLYNTQLNNSFKSKQVIKVITGIYNTSLSQITNIAIAAQLANASYLDVVANTKIVKFIKSFSSLPLCISSINPIDIYNCLSAGADLVEVGNYDSFYNCGIYLTDVQLINLIKEIKFLIGNIDICVTIPYYLDLNAQINLAQDLEDLGVNILQTEGCFVNHKSQNYSSITPSLSSSLLSTYSISKYVNIPVIASSSMISMFSYMATYYGASGIGIGSAISSQNNIADMVNYINEVRDSILTTPFEKYGNFYDIETTFSVTDFNERIIRI